MTLEAFAKLIFFRETTKLFLHGEVTGSKPVTVAEYLHRIISRSQSSVHIPIYRHRHLLVGILHLTWGCRLYALAIDLEITAGTEQRAFGRYDTHIECLHARSGRIIGTDSKADTKLACLGYILFHLSFFITNLSNLVLYITSKNFSLVYSTKDSPLFLFIICIFFNYIFILLLLFFFKNHSEISIFYSIFFHLLCKTCFFRNFMLYYYSTFL